MAQDTEKMVVVPIDGSENVLKTLNYINLFFGPQHPLKITLFYVLPRLPPVWQRKAAKAAKLSNRSKISKKRMPKWPIVYWQPAEKD